jgi:hypothetical protein
MANRFQTISSNASLPAIVTQVNRSFKVLDNENRLKEFRSTTGATMLQGSIDNDRFGTLFRQGDLDVMFDGFYRSDRYGKIMYDSSGVPIALQGQAPDDGRTGEWFAKPGQNVITLLGG